MGRGWETWTTYVSDQEGGECIALKLLDIRGYHDHLHQPTLTWVVLVLRGYVGQNWREVRKGRCEGGGLVA
jgi:hypothetical protein